MKSVRHIVISPQCVRGLREISFQNSDLTKLVCDWIPHAEEQCFYSIPEDVCEDIRSILTKLLAEFGFEEDYQPNRRGMLIEDLIDKFADYGR